MLKEYKGDLLKSGCDIICHQVNLQGIMGGGLALQIATKYPECEKEYKKYLESVGKAQALYNIVNCYDYFGGKHLDKVVVNCFSQNEDFTTNYEQLKLIVKELKKQIKTDCKLWLENHIITIGIPKNYGCGIAKGNWETVKKIWCNAFKNEDKLELQIWEF